MSAVDAHLRVSRAPVRYDESDGGGRKERVRGGGGTQECGCGGVSAKLASTNHDDDGATPPDPDASRQIRLAEHLGAREHNSHERRSMLLGGVSERVAWGCGGGCVLTPRLRGTQSAGGVRTPPVRAYPKQHASDQRTVVLQRRDGESEHVEQKSGSCIGQPQECVRATAGSRLFIPVNQLLRSLRTLQEACSTHRRQSTPHATDDEWQRLVSSATRQ